MSRGKIRNLNLVGDNYYFIHEDGGRITFCRKGPKAASDDDLKPYEETIKMLCEYLLIRQPREVG